MIKFRDNRAYCEDGKVDKIAGPKSIAALLFMCYQLTAPKIFGNSSDIPLNCYNIRAV